MLRQAAAIVGMIPVLTLMAGRYEAEDASLQGVESVKHDQASGGARVRNIDAAGDSIEIAVREPGETVRIWYSLDGREERQGTLRADTGQAQTVTFRPTGGWISTPARSFRCRSSVACC